MRVGGRTHGYTIVEVLVFLGVTAILFVTVALSLTGQQGKAEFSHGMREVQAQIDDIINDVSTGYYASAGQFTCTEVGTEPQIQGVANARGENQDCIFIGRALQFNVAAGDSKRMVLYSIIGLRQIAESTTDVSNLTEAKPRPLAPTDASEASTVPDLSEEVIYPVGVTIGSVTYGGGVEIDGVAFVSGLDSIGSGAVEQGTIPVSVYTLGDGGTAKTKLAMANVINLIETNAPSPDPDGGVQVCFISDSSNQHAIITIGGAAGKLTTTLNIGGGNSCA